jgi:nitrogen fixation NifU-like protein
MHDLDDSDFLAHFEFPYHRGRLTEPSISQHLRNAVCGDWVNLEVRLTDGDRVEVVYFEGQGCIVSQSAASILCQRVEGITLRELADLGPMDMLSWIDIPLLARRQQCALLAFRALKMIAYSYVNKI